VVDDFIAVVKSVIAVVDDFIAVAKSVIAVVDDFIVVVKSVIAVVDDFIAVIKSVIAVVYCTNNRMFLLKPKAIVKTMKLIDFMGWVRDPICRYWILNQ
jgi:hypothetical protein